MPERRFASIVLALVSIASGWSCGGNVDPEIREVAVEVGYVALDPRSRSPVVVLEESGGTRRLPIWIGFAEARSIATELDQDEPLRPNTHDLATRLIAGLDGVVERVVVTELREGIYFASIVLRNNGERLEIDARPSDAIAIALRVHAPLFVRDPVLERGGEDLIADEDAHEI